MAVLICEICDRAIAVRKDQVKRFPRVLKEHKLSNPEFNGKLYHESCQKSLLPQMRELKKIGLWPVKV